MCFHLLSGKKNISVWDESNLGGELKGLGKFEVVERKKKKKKNGPTSMIFYPPSFFWCDASTPGLSLFNAVFVCTFALGYF